MQSGQEIDVPSNERVTVPEIAEQRGVPLSTVSLVLREGPGLTTMHVDKVGMGRLARDVAEQMAQEGNA
jgi:DNA-binding LacI/PurR family transcriptional regulator